MKHPIYIPSKGRPNCPTLARLLEESADNVTVIVEEQDLKDYTGNFPGASFLVLPESNKGITYVRNFILQHSRDQGHEWFWMLDDDILNMFLVEGGKTIKCSFTKAMSTAEDLITINPVAMGAMEYNQYAWAQRKPYTLNSYCDCVVLVNVERTRHINYREACKGKEDRDFVLQLLAIGRQVMRSTWTAFAVPKLGTNTGGLQSEYQNGMEKRACEKMREVWPGVCEIVTKNDGRTDLKIHWKKAMPKK